MVEGILCQHKEIPGRFADPPWNRDSEDWIRLDRQLADDHLAREIDLAVGKLDLRPLFGAYFGVGKKPCRPDLLLKVVLYESERGRQSPAEWFRDTRESIPVRWLAMGMLPSRSTLYDFRDRCWSFVEQANRQVLEMALARGVTKADRGALDGSTIAACASRHHYATEPALDNRTAQLKDAIQADESGKPVEGQPGWMASTPSGRMEQLLHLGRVRENLTRRQQENEQRPSKRKASEKVTVSWSDPEAAVGLDKFKVYRPLYNVQVIQDLDSPLVLAYDVFAQQNDMGTLTPMLERVTDLVGHKPKQVLADSGYLSVRDVENCELAGIELYAPWQENDYSEKSKIVTPPVKIPKSAFTWEPDQHAYRCPEGHQLPFTKTTTQKRTEGQEVTMEIFTCPSQHCQGCPRKEACTSQKARTVTRIEGEDSVDKLRARMKTEEAKSLYRLRQQTVELRFADVKAHRKLRCFNGRGLERVKIQTATNVLVHNLLTVARHTNQSQATDVELTVLMAAA